MSNIGTIILVVIIIILLFLICSFLYGLLLKFAGPGSAMLFLQFAQAVIHA